MSSLTNLGEIKFENTERKEFKPLDILLKSEIMNFQMKRSFMKDFSLLVPVANIFEIFQLEINNRPFFFENLKIFELEALQEKVIFDSISDRKKRSNFNLVLKKSSSTWELYEPGSILDYTNLQISIIPNANKAKSYVIPEIQNYNESRHLKFNFNETMKQLKICTFRVKRHLALKESLTQYINDLYNFKYPVFSTFMFILAIFMTSLMGIQTTLGIMLIFFILVKHPDIKRRTDMLFNYFFFDPKFLNK